MRAEALDDAARTFLRGKAIAYSIPLLAFLLYSAVALYSLHAFPFSGDEYSYLLQATLFREGHFAVPSPPYRDLVPVDHVVIDALVRSKYPPGNAALLSLGVLLGAPALVNPFVTAITLAVLYRLGEGAFGRGAGLFAMIFFGASPLIVLQATSFYAHPLLCLQSALALFACCHPGLGRSHGPLVVLGTAVGTALLTRPLDGVLLLASVIATRVVTPFRKGWLLVGGLVAACAVLGLSYNRIQFGGFLRTGYEANEAAYSSAYGPVAHIALPTRSSLEDDFRAIFGLLTRWGAMGLVPVATLYAAFGRKGLDAGGEHTDTPSRGIHCIHVFAALSLAVLFILPSNQDDAFGPRYLSTALVALSLLSGAGLRLILQRLSPLSGSPVLSFLALCIFASTYEVHDAVHARMPERRLRQGLYEQVKAQGIHHAAVLVHATFPTRYARNGPHLEGDVLYVSNATPASLRRTFPDRALYVAEEGTPWRLVSVEAP